MELDIEKDKEIEEDTKDWLISFGVSLFAGSIAVAFREKLSELLEYISKRKVE